MDLDFKLYIRQDAFILIPVLYFIGLILKDTPYIPEWTYRWIQLIFAVIACLLYYGIEIQSVVQGILVTGATMISEDLFKNTIHGINTAINKKDDN
ncbi:phage holin family protein [Bacillus sp. JJ1533]|uniref:phage holin family protein n=1 Tax=Bacillus sp. JJ1533 TaxID=3122959 RepID=UPI002FFF51F1